MMLFFDDTKKLYWREIDVEGNIISYKEEGGLNNTTYEMDSRKNIFPVIHRVAHSEKDNLIEKKGLEIIETYNTKGLIEKGSFNDLEANKKK